MTRASTPRSLTERPARRLVAGMLHHRLVLPSAAAQGVEANKLAGTGSVSRGGAFRCVTVPLSPLLSSYSSSWVASRSLRETTNPCRRTSAGFSHRVECHCLLGAQEPRLAWTLG